MNNKIKIVTKYQEITNEELDRLMDFDALLTKYNQAKRGGTWIKWMSVILILAITSSAALYFASVENGVDLQEKGIEKVVPEQAPTSPSQETLAPDTNGANDLKKFKKAITPKPIEKSIEERQQEEVSDVIAESVEREEEEVEKVKTAPVYIQAEPLNGYPLLYQYFNRELIFPPEAVKDSIQGILKVSFVIDRNGNVGNLQFINSLGKLFEEEAARLIGKMPPWKPATLDGHPVPSKMTLPLTFKIQATEKNKTKQ